MLNKELNEILSKYKSLEFHNEKNKIICKWSGHEMPLRLESVQTYVNGTKYKNLLQKNIIKNEDLDKYSEFLVPTRSKNPIFKNQLFCKLTMKHVNKQPDHIQLHFNGYRFQKAYKHWIYCKENNQEFVPFCKQKKLKENDEMLTDENDNDSMSDLYPEMFELIENDEDESNQNKKLNNELNKNGKSKSIHIEKDIEEMSMNCESENGNNGLKRKLDGKLNKKHKIEPQRKKNNFAK